MNRIVRCAAVFALSVASRAALAQRPNAPDSASEAARTAIVQIERDWGLAGARHDVTVFERHVGDDFVGIYPTRRVGKRELIADASRPSTRTVLTSDPVAQFEVKAYGTTAVARGLAIQSFRDADGTESVTRTIYTEVFVMRDGRWQCVSGQYTQLATAK